MNLDQNLYRELEQLRERIKNKERRISGRAPIVCADNALYEIVELVPRKRDDFYSIMGIGDKFIDNYSDAFLQVINSYLENDDVRCNAISPTTNRTMRELEKKLVNINRRNRLLYLPKIYRKYAYDLLDQNKRYDPMQIIFSNKKVKICDIRLESLIRGQSGEDKYKRIAALLREVEKDFRDKGQYDLYIGYPFVEGRLAGENFDIRAPLVLFPIEYEKDANYITINIDKTKDVIYNSNLLLAHYKFNGLHRSLPDCTLSDVSEETFLNKVIEFYKNEGIEISHTNSGLSKFTDYRSGEFSKA